MSLIGGTMKSLDFEEELQEARGLVGTIEIACCGDCPHIDNNAADWMYFTARQAREKLDKIYDNISKVDIPTISKEKDGGNGKENLTSIQA